MKYIWILLFIIIIAHNLNNLYWQWWSLAFNCQLPTANSNTTIESPTHNIFHIFN